MRKTTMEDIAEAAGMRAASIYYYFKNKEEVFAAAVHALTDAFLERLGEELELADSAEAKLIRYMEVRQAFSRGIEDQYSVSTDILFEVMPLVHETIADARAVDLKILEGILDDGVADGSFDVDDVGAVARTLRACVDSVTQPTVKTELDDEVDCPTLFRILVRGISRETVGTVSSPDEEGR